MLEVILDTETTGLSVKDGHSVVEIGCVELDNLIPTSKKFHCYLTPERKVSEKAFEVHGYTDEFLLTKQKFKEIADDFLNFINNKRLIIHNPEFDLSHLNNELSLLGKNKINKKNDVLIFVDAKKSQINKKLKKRKNFNLKLFKKFKKIQLPIEYKKKKSQFILKNNFTNKFVKKGVKIILKKIL